MVKRVLIAFDVDHTLIDETIDTYVLRLLPDGGQLPPSIQKMYSIHEWNDYQREVFRYLHKNHVTKEVLLSCIDEIPLVKGMRELLEYLGKFKIMAAMADAKNESFVPEKDAAVNGVTHTQVAENGYYDTQQQQHSVINGAGTLPPTVENGFIGPAAGPYSVTVGKVNPSDSPVQFEIIILSDANLAIINHILETTGLQSVFSKVYTNPSSFDNAGCLHLSPYHRQDWCNMSPANMCKGHILDEHCRKSDISYDVVAFVGDGEPDFCPTVRLRETDIVFPRRNFPLDEHVAKGRDKVAAMVRSWDTGFDILNALKEILMNVSE